LTKQRELSLTGAGTHPEGTGGPAGINERKLKFNQGDRMTSLFHRHRKRVKGDDQFK